jgi:hypothetical protein
VSIVAVESAIVARLVERLKVVAPAALAPGQVREVYTQAEYTSVPEANLVTPSVAVVYTGYTPGPKAANSIQEIQFGWLVVVNVRNARNVASGQGVRDDASPLVETTLEALLGFRPIPKFKPLQLEPAPGAALTDAGFGYFPLAFSTAATYRGTPA